ncbi:MAG: glycosyltransferase [Gemmatimonadota bacterium]|nr:glycosyltransferase [Gemmatimonadota bacterium]
MSADPLLSICIATYDSRDYLQACLASIYKFPPPCSYEIVVVNDFSGDGTAEMVREEFIDVNFVENQERVGVCPAENMAFRHSNGQYVVLFDADAEFITDTLTTLFEFMQEHPGAGIVTCTLMDPDGTLQPSGRKFPTARSLLRDRLITLLRLPINIYHQPYRNYDAVEEVDEVPITCLLMPRSLGEPDGYFDEGVFVFYCDIELCHRIKFEGWKIYQVPGCQVLHHRGVNRKHPSVRLIVNGYRDELYYFKKWYPVSMVRAVKVIQAAELCIRMIKWGLLYLAIPARRDTMRERCAGGLVLLKEIWKA